MTGPLPPPITDDFFRHLTSEERVAVAHERLREVSRSRGSNRAPAIAAAKELLNRFVGKSASREQTVRYKTSIPPPVMSDGTVVTFELGSDVRSAS